MIALLQFVVITFFVKTALIAEGVTCAYMYPSFSMPTAEPISKMTISNACGFGCASFVYLDPFVA
jgi:hypothetical protein